MNLIIKDSTLGRTGLRGGGGGVVSPPLKIFLQFFSGAFIVVYYIVVATTTSPTPAPALWPECVFTFQDVRYMAASVRMYKRGFYI